MLNKITISGYKSLQDTVIQFAPFTAIVGRNNVGKSNVFDALQLLSNLAGMPASNAFKPDHHRGDPIESFSSENHPHISMQCDFDLTDQSNSQRPLSKLHYQLELGFLAEEFVFESEKLEDLTDSNKVKSLVVVSDKRTSTLVAGVKEEQANYLTLPSPTSIFMRIVDDDRHPEVVALARELRSWRFFRFEPDQMREPSPVLKTLELEPTGRGLSGFYYTLRENYKDRFQAAEHALRRGIPEAHNIHLIDTGDRRRLLAIERDDGREFTTRVLSDGTLRFLALLALAYAPEPPALVYFEEPENGVHPGRLPFIVDTLRSLSQRVSVDGRRTQVIVNSHSPYFVDLLQSSELLIASINPKGQTRFQSVDNDILPTRQTLKEILESGEQTLGELWSQGSFDATS